MLYTYDIDFFKCGTCTCKTHCRECGEEAADIVMGMDGVLAAKIDIMEHRADFELDDNADEDELLDMLDNMGILV